MLVGTSDGLYQLNAPFSYRQQLVKLLHAVDVRDVLTDQTGLIWLSTRNRGVFTLGLRQDKFNLLTDQQQQSKFEQGLHRIASQYLHQGTIWLGLEQQVLSFQLQSRQWQQHPFAPDSQVSLVTGLTVDPSGQTWAATNAGLFRLDGKKGFIKEQRPFSMLTADINLMSLSHSADGTLNLAVGIKKSAFALLNAVTLRPANNGLPAAPITPNQPAGPWQMAATTAPCCQLWLGNCCNWVL